MQVLNPLSLARRRLSVRALAAVGCGAGLVALVVVVRSVDGADLGRAARQAGEEPLGVATALAAFGLAFVLRAAAWCRVLRDLSFRHSLAGIHLALGANHVLPFRLGEPLRPVSAARRAGTDLEAAAASTITLRAADVMAVVGLGLVLAPGPVAELLGGRAGWILLTMAAVVAAAGLYWLGSVARRRPGVALPGPGVVGLSVAAWLAEAVLVWHAARWAGLDVSWSDAVLVTAAAVAAQVAAIAPGGFGTYEAGAVAAYVALGHDARTALVAALGAHALKTAYSVAAGAVAVFVPAPSLLGRFRLGRTARPAETATAGASRAEDRRPVAPVRPDLPTASRRPVAPVRSDLPTAARPAVAPVLFFMPAHNEESTVEACVGRAPGTVLGHPVEVLVVDDGSTDDTAIRAAAAGAEVLTLPQNRGLGAAVRVGLAVGVERAAAAVAFCDADGEYRPQDLADLVGPILGGEADYVVGSRFLGCIDRMPFHRRIGNVVLTRALSFIARRRITDGQSGYRAFSSEAAGAAEIIHDFNYAQVLTLDLLAKGYRYLEVPIGYHFRTAGQSFVKLGRYLRNVIPAVYRELNSA